MGNSDWNSTKPSTSGHIHSIQIFHDLHIAPVASLYQNQKILVWLNEEENMSKTKDIYHMKNYLKFATICMPLDKPGTSARTAFTWHYNTFIEGEKLWNLKLNFLMFQSTYGHDLFTKICIHKVTFKPRNFLAFFWLDRIVYIFKYQCITVILNFLNSQKLYIN